MFKSLTAQEPRSRQSIVTVGCVPVETTGIVAWRVQRTNSRPRWGIHFARAAPVSSPTVGQNNSCEPACRRGWVPASLTTAEVLPLTITTRPMENGVLTVYKRLWIRARHTLRNNHLPREIASVPGGRSRRTNALLVVTQSADCTAPLRAVGLEHARSWRTSGIGCGTRRGPHGRATGGRGFTFGRKEGGGHAVKFLRDAVALLENERVDCKVKKKTNDPSAAGVFVTEGKTMVPTGTANAGVLNSRLRGTSLS